MEPDAYTLLDYLLDEVYGAVYDLGIGTAVWLVALVLPFRALKGGVEIGWDVVGYVATIVFGFAVVMGSRSRSSFGSSRSSTSGTRSTTCSRGGVH